MTLWFCSRIRLRKPPAANPGALSVVTLLLAFASQPALAQLAAPNENIDLLGSPGIVEMPSAHMSKEGMIHVWAAGTDFTQRYGFTFQALPWLEGSFRYIGTSNLLHYSTYYDRSFGMRVRLQDEVYGWPDITVGLLDMVGTSLESGEYIEASKHFGPFDVTLGLGWGRLAGTGMFDNPFIYLSQRFSKRAIPTAAGQVEFGDFFRGPDTSLFGGVVWDTPIDGLRLLGEYSSDNYHLETSQNVFKPATQFNVGTSYRLTDWFQLTAAWLYGRKLMVGMDLDIDPTVKQIPQRLGAPPLPAVYRSDEELTELARGLLVTLKPTVQSTEIFHSNMIAWIGGQTVQSVSCSEFGALIDTAHRSGLREVIISDVGNPAGTVKICPADRYKVAASDNAALAASFVNETMQDDSAQLRQARAKILDLAAKQGLEIDALTIEDTQVNVVFTNSVYRTETEAYGRLARVLMAALPAKIETFRFVSLVGGMPAREIVLPRSALERVMRVSGDGSELLPSATTDTDAPSPTLLGNGQTARYPRFDWSILPVLNQSLFDPNQPYRFELLAGLHGGVELMRGFRLDGEVQANVFDTFADLRPSNSALPHVRSNYNLYFKKGKNGISDLQTSYQFTLVPGVYVLAKAGYLESMFAGAGGEVLWRPEGMRWALDLSAYEVWQRGFDRLFDLQHYHVLTGHIGLYYESPFHGLNFEVLAGRYLAGDYGTTFQISRRFDTGVEIGLFATLTNVPFKKFGEGSFDKGFEIRIPIDWMEPVNAQSEWRINLRPVSRDGGQQLEDEETLYDQTRRTSYGDVQLHADDIISP